MKARPLVLLALVLVGCAHNHASIESAKAAPSNWHMVATNDDRDRLRNWRQAWLDAIDLVRGAGKGDALAGPLFAYDQAQDDPLPPPGDYHCTVIKLGGTNPRVAAVTIYPVQPCRVATDGPVTSFTILGGKQRPTGLIFKDGSYRGVFLGTVMLADEDLPLAYGRDAGRDLAGRVERVAAGQWRIALPYPHFESTLDVIELTR